MDQTEISFCPQCFACERSGSCDHVVVGGHCTNCGNTATVMLPAWAVDSVRKNASWVGKRFYPCQEDLDRAEELSDLYAIVEEFPGRTATRCVDSTNHYTVTQMLPGGNGRRVINTSIGASPQEAMRRSGLRYVPAHKLGIDVVGETQPNTGVSIVSPSITVKLLSDAKFASQIETCNWRDGDTPFDEQGYGAHLLAEEMHELGQAIIKYYTRRKQAAYEKVHEEAIDTLLMLDQLLRMLSEDELQRWMKFKLDRTIERYHSPDSMYDDSAQF